MKYEIAIFLEIEKLSYFGKIWKIIGFSKKTFYLEGGVVTGETGGVEGDVGHGPGLAHHEDLERLRHLAASQDSRVDQLPTLQ